VSHDVPDADGTACWAPPWDSLGTEQKEIKRVGAGAAETSHIAADPAPARRQRRTATRAQEAVLRVLRDEDVASVSRSLEALAVDVSGGRDAFLEGDASNLKHRPRDARDEEIDRPRAKGARSPWITNVSLRRSRRWRRAILSGA